VELTSEPSLAADRRAARGGSGRLRNVVRAARGLPEPAQARW
jgi:hypothetical protein